MGGSLMDDKIIEVDHLKQVVFTGEMVKELLL